MADEFAIGPGLTSVAFQSMRPETGFQNVKSLSLRLVIVSIVAIAAVFGIGLFVMISQVSQTINEQTTALQQEATQTAAMLAQQQVADPSIAAKGMIDTVVALRTQGVANRSQGLAALDPDFWRPHGSVR